MAKGPSGFMHAMALQGLETLVNTGEPWPDVDEAWPRVRRMQTKLHHWATDDPGRRFSDLFNLVYHPDFITVAWDRVKGNKGARTAGVDRVAPALVAASPHITGTNACWRAAQPRTPDRRLHDPPDPSPAGDTARAGPP
jgi:hypothetical protein